MIYECSVDEMNHDRMYEMKNVNELTSHAMFHFVDSDRYPTIRPLPQYHIINPK